jgi:hypothetical protein
MKEALARLGFYFLMFYQTLGCESFLDCGLEGAVDGQNRESSAFKMLGKYCKKQDKDSYWKRCL